MKKAAKNNAPILVVFNAANRKARFAAVRVAIKKVFFVVEFQFPCTGKC
jgi:hypothetical protein